MYVVLGQEGPQVLELLHSQLLQEENVQRARAQNVSYGRAPYIPIAFRQIRRGGSRDHANLVRACVNALAIRTHNGVAGMKQ
eukprot:3548113-Rhodomonas_salina.1